MTYAFDNAASEAGARLAALATIYDPGTIRHLAARGVGDGWKCLEIGGGSGTITRWLAERVGLRGSVLTTDIDTRFLETIRLPNVEVRRHDIAAESLPGGIFDLVYTRLVLQHVSDSDTALTHMAAALRPGGWLVVEDFESLPAALDSDGRPVESISKTKAAMHQVLAATGARGLGRSLARRVRAKGLADVDIEGRVFLSRGGTAGTALLRLNFLQLRDRILATGMLSPEEFDADVASLDHEDFESRSPILWTAWGRRPDA